MRHDHPRYNLPEAIVRGLISNAIRPWRFVRNIRSVIQYTDKLLAIIEDHFTPPQEGKS